MRLYISEPYGTVIPFDIEGVSSAASALMLANRYGVATRVGSFCTYELIRRFKGIGPAEDERLLTAARAGNTADLPGIVRASFSIYNRPEDVTRFVEAVNESSRHAP